MKARIPAIERRQQILEAAFRVISREGVSAASTRAICQDAGVPQSVFHYCFHTKREMLEQLITITVKGLEDASPPSVENAETNELLRSLLLRLWREVRGHPERQLSLYELTTTALRTPDLEDLARWQYRSYFESMEAKLIDIERAGNLEWRVPRSQLARMMLSAFDGLILGWLTDNDDSAVEAALDGYAEAFAAMATHLPTVKEAAPA